MEKSSALPNECLNENFGHYSVIMATLRTITVTDPFDGSNYFSLKTLKINKKGLTVFYDKNIFFLPCRKIHPVSPLIRHCSDKPDFLRF